MRLEISLDGQRFADVGERFVDNRLVMRVYSGHCAECGAAFEQVALAAAAGAGKLTRRCVEHRQSGKPVRTLHPRCLKAPVRPKPNAPVQAPRAVNAAAILRLMKLGLGVGAALRQAGVIGHERSERMAEVLRRLEFIERGGRRGRYRVAPRGQDLLDLGFEFNISRPVLKSIGLRVGDTRLGLFPATVREHGSAAAALSASSWPLPPAEVEFVEHVMACIAAAESAAVKPQCELENASV